MNSAFRAIWLVPLSRDIKYYSPPLRRIGHVLLLPISQFRFSCIIALRHCVWVAVLYGGCAQWFFRFNISSRLISFSYLDVLISEEVPFFCRLLILFSLVLFVFRWTHYTKPKLINLWRHRAWATNNKHALTKKSSTIVAKPPLFPGDEV